MGTIVQWVLSKTNGYKSIIGYLVSSIAKFVEAKWPGAPVSEGAVVLQYLGEALLIWGLSHKAVKVSKETVSKKKK